MSSAAATADDDEPTSTPSSVLTADAMPVVVVGGGQGGGAIHFAKHRRFFMSCLKGLTYHYAGNDLNRLMVAYFCVNGLDMMGALDKIPKNDVIEWIYALQIQPDDRVEGHFCGFRGSTCFREVGLAAGGEYDTPHIAMSYTALASLKSLGDDLSRVCKDALLTSMAKLQQDDGSFLAYPWGGERDMRFVYCACAISSMLGDWRAVRRGRAVDYIRACMCYDGGISLIPGQESHGGSTYCAVASLYLMDPDLAQLSQQEKDDITAWCLSRQQVHGFQGRCNKDPDTCYSFWIGATLRLLGRFDLVSCSKVKCFHVECQDNFYGGFSKYPDHLPDVLHSFYSVCFLSMSEEEEVRPIDCSLAICADKVASDPHHHGGSSSMGKSCSAPANTPAGVYSGGTAMEAESSDLGGVVPQDE